MADRWPAAMNRPTAAEYLGVAPTTFDGLARDHRIPSFQYTERGDRYYHREDLDAYLESRRGKPVQSRAA